MGERFFATVNPEDLWPITVARRGAMDEGYTIESATELRDVLSAALELLAGQERSDVRP